MAKIWRDMMNCPHCKSKMIKQIMPTHGGLDVVHVASSDLFDTIVQWYKCSNANCPMSVYMSNRA